MGAPRRRILREEADFDKRLLARLGAAGAKLNPRQIGVAE
jgi:hypothetical protein